MSFLIDTSALSELFKLRHRFAVVTRNETDFADTAPLSAPEAMTSGNCFP